MTLLTLLASNEADPRTQADFAYERWQARVAAGELRNVRERTYRRKAALTSVDGSIAAIPTLDLGDELGLGGGVVTTADSRLQRELEESAMFDII